MSTCTCHPCGRQFSGLAPFDAHQDVDYSRRPAVKCLDPATLGLVQDPVSGRWGTTDGSAKREQGARLAASSAASRLSQRAQSAERDEPGVPGTPGPLAVAAEAGE